MVIVALPSAIAVTTPVELTLATDEFDELHVTFLFVALLGRTVTVNVAFSPSVRSRELEDNVIDVTFTSGLNVHIGLTGADIIEAL